MGTPSDASTPSTETGTGTDATAVRSAQDASMRPPVTLTIAGSEATGGAGINMAFAAAKAPKNAARKRPAAPV